MSWKDILKSYEISKLLKQFIYRTEIKPNLYEFLPEANDSVKEFQMKNRKGFELYLSDIFDYITSKVSKDELTKFYREQEGDWEDMPDDEEPYDPRKIQKIIYEAMKVRKP
tara:strand:+ start:1647 stop:1979 length:333 start_codon:yes stop_codon:yes gene_type:complete